jgi:hypothetical protein
MRTRQRSGQGWGVGRSKHRACVSDRTLHPFQLPASTQSHREGRGPQPEQACRPRTQHTTGARYLRTCHAKTGEGDGGVVEEGEAVRGSTAGVEVGEYQMLLLPSGDALSEAVLVGVLLTLSLPDAVSEQVTVELELVVAGGTCVGLAEGDDVTDASEDADTLGVDVGAVVPLALTDEDPDDDPDDVLVLEAAPLRLAVGVTDTVAVPLGVPVDDVLPLRLLDPDGVTVRVSVEVALTEPLTVAVLDAVPVDDTLAVVDADRLMEAVSDVEAVRDRVGDEVAVGLGVTGVHEPAPGPLNVSGGHGTAVSLADPAGQ